MSASSDVPGVLELRWVDEHPEIVAKYDGLWIAVEGREFIAASPSTNQLLDIVKEKGITNPFVMRVNLKAPRFQFKKRQEKQEQLRRHMRAPQAPRQGGDAPR